MNLKKTIVSFMAAGAVIAGGFAGVSAQDADDSASQPLAVSVTADGVFDVKFCGDSTGDFGTRMLNSTNYDTDPLSTVVTICYDDTLVERGAFDAYLSADEFVGASPENTIAASNLTLGHLSIMNSGQWDGQDGPIGEVSALTGSGLTAINSHDGADWDGGTLDASQQVHVGYEGVGTGGTLFLDTEDPKNPGNNFGPEPRSEAGSWQEMELLLTVPHSTVTDTYTSTLTIEVNFGGNP